MNCNYHGYRGAENCPECESARNPTKPDPPKTEELLAQILDELKEINSRVGGTLEISGNVTTYDPH